jgi:hypothetical protein
MARNPSRCRCGWTCSTTPQRGSAGVTAEADRLSWALALLADALGDDDLAVRLHQFFKSRVVACWPEGERWWITADQIAAVVNVIEQENGQPGKENKQLQESERAAASGMGSLSTGGPDAA